MSKLFVLLLIWAANVQANDELPPLPGTPSWDERIVGGVEIDIEDAPYQVGLFTKFFNFLLIFQCGGSIISENLILTASHCFNHEHLKLYVQAGSSEVGRGGQLKKVKKAFLHPELDAMILKLATNLEFNEKVRPISLPEVNLELPFDTMLVVSGWGRTAQGGEISEILKAVEVPLRDPAVCYDAYKNRAKNPIAIIEKHAICAGSPDGGKDSCQGDSGGPLAYRTDANTTTLIGIVSYGEGCANPIFPGVYTKVAALLDWIHDIKGQ